MGLRDGLKPTGRAGVFFKEHESRRHGVRKDRLIVLRYTINGKTYVESFGWLSEGASEIEAERKIIDFRANFKNASGPTSLREEREAAQRDKRIAEARQRKEITVEKLVDEYVDRYAKRHKRSWQEDERALKKDLVPVLGNLRAKDVTRQDAASLLDSIVNRGAPVQACNMLEKCRKLFNQALEWGYVEYNPFAGMKKPAPRPSRKRVLSDEEIRIFWKVLDEDNTSIAMSSEMRRAFRLLLVTGQRPGEVIGMHHQEIDGRWWTIPSERVKTGNDHRVFLTDLALELIGTGEGYVFSSPKEGGGHIAENAMAMSLRRNILGASNGKPAKGLAGRKKHAAKRKLENPPPINRIGVEHFVPHDLRRTVLTNLAKMKVPYEVRERIVNHSLGKLEDTYNRHDYDEEKAAALIRWADRLKTIIDGMKSAKVVNIRP